MFVIEAGLEWWLNLSTALGIVILAVPVLSLNKRKKALARIPAMVERRKKDDDAILLDTIGAELKSELGDRVNTWRRTDEYCLYIGYLLLLASSCLRLIL